MKDQRWDLQIFWIFFQVISELCEESLKETFQLFKEI
jgi:hypothetical protein